MALEAARNNFRGHWNMRGEKPYHRYADAGGLDHVAENASAYYSTAKINNSFRSCVKLMRESHKRFMAEKAPNDGHKKNVIKKTHNYVGLGFALSGTQFRYYEEYIDRYLDIRTGPLKIKQGEEVFFKFKPIDDSEYPYAVFAYREAPLKEMTPAEINRKSSYPDYSREKSLKLWPWELEEADSEGYTAVRFKADKKGTYYIHIYLSREKYQSGKSASTRGKAIVSGIVFSAE